MTDENVFEGLNEQLEAVEGDDADDEPVDKEPTDDAPDAEPAATDTTPASDPDTNEPDAEDGPAFDFDNDMQQSIYIRDETWDAFVDTADFDVKRALRNDGVREITGREIQDAALRVAAERPEAIIEKFYELRNED